MNACALYIGECVYMLADHVAAADYAKAIEVHNRTIEQRCQSL